MDQLEPAAGAGEQMPAERQDEQKGQVPAERRLTGRADAGGTAGRPGQVGTG